MARQRNNIDDDLIGPSKGVAETLRAEKVRIHPDTDPFNVPSAPGGIDEKFITTGGKRFERTRGVEGTQEKRSGEKTSAAGDVAVSSKDDDAVYLEATLSSRSDSGPRVKEVSHQSAIRVRAINRPLPRHSVKTKSSGEDSDTANLLAMYAKGIFTGNVENWTNRLLTAGVLAVGVVLPADVNGEYDRLIAWITYVGAGPPPPKYVDR